eukprot:14683802-Alexandrium_andersonii.AAC.1
MGWRENEPRAGRILGTAVPGAAVAESDGDGPGRAPGAEAPGKPRRKHAGAQGTRDRAAARGRRQSAAES